MKSVRSHTLPLWVVLLLFVLSPLASQAERAAYLVHFYTYQEMSHREPTLPPSLTSLSRLYENYHRETLPVSSSVHVSDTAAWDLFKTTKEANALFEALLSERAKLLKTPAREAMRSLSVRRLEPFYFSNEGQTLYDIVLYGLGEFQRAQRQRARELGPQYKELATASRALMQRELSSAFALKAYPSARLLLLMTLEPLSDAEAKLSALQKARTRFPRGRERSLLDQEILSTLEGENDWWVLLSEVPPSPTLLKKTETLSRQIIKALEVASVDAIDETSRRELAALRSRLLATRMHKKVKCDYRKKQLVVSLQSFSYAPMLGYELLDKNLKVLKSKYSQYFAPASQEIRGEYIQDTIRLPLPPVGAYTLRITPSGGPSKEEVSTSVVLCEEMHVVDHPIRNGMELSLLSQIDGAPLANVEVEVRSTSEKGKKLLKKLKSDPHGRLSYTTQEGGRFELFVSDPRLARPRTYPFWVAPPRETSEERTFSVLTDRPIYRYGQTLQIALVASRQKGKKRSLVSDVAGHVALVALQRGRPIRLDSVPFRSDAQGVAHVPLNLPQETSYDAFYLDVRGTDLAKSTFRQRHDLNVQAYKRSYLSLQIDSIPTSCVQGRPLKVCGRTLDLNGHPVPATVTLSWRPWQQIQTQSDDQGRFTLQTPPLESREEYDYLSFTLNATDPMGHTASLSRYMMVRGTSIHLDASRLLAPHQSVNKTLPLTISLLDQPYWRDGATFLKAFGEQYAPYEIEVGLVSKKRTYHPLGKMKGSLERQEYDLSKFPSGAYRLRLSCKDYFGTPLQSEGEEFYIYSPTDKQPPHTTAAWMTTEESELVGTTPLRLRAGSSYDSYAILLVKDQTQRVVSRQLLHFSKEIKEISIPYPQEVETLHVSLSGLWNGNEEVKSLTISRKEDPSRSLSVERLLPSADPYRPNQTIRETLLVKDGTGRPLPEVRLVVAVVDKAALDAARGDHPWKLFASSRGGGYRILRSVSQSRGAVQNMMESYASERTEMVEMASAPLSKSASMVADALEEGGESPLDPSSLREDFAETAYFSASLVTDKRGCVSFTCTLPGSETEYVVRVLAFDPKDLREKYETSSFRATLPLSLDLALPRFLTRGDWLDGVAVAKNHLDIPQDVRYRVQSSGELLGSGSGRVESQGLVSFPFVLPSSVSLSGDSLWFEGRLDGEGLVDEIRRGIPLRPNVSTYRVARPFSIYRSWQTSLELDKVQERESQAYDIDVYLSPLHVLLSKMAHEDSWRRGKEWSEVPLWEALNTYQAYGVMSDYLERHPEVMKMLRESVRSLREVVHPDGTGVGGKESRGSEASSAHTSRVASPSELLGFYTFMTDSQQRRELLSALERRILSFCDESSGAFSWGEGRRSIWLTLSALSSLSEVPDRVLSPRLRQVAVRGTKYIDSRWKASVEEVRWFDVIGYALVRARFAPSSQAMPSALAKRLREEERRSREGYERFGTSELLRYDKYVRAYLPDRVREVGEFLGERAKWTRSDREKLMLQTHLALRSPRKGALPREVVSFMLSLKQGTLWDYPYATEAIRLLLDNVAPTRIERDAVIRIGEVGYPLSPLERAVGHFHRHLEGQISGELSFRGVTSDFIFGGLSYEVTSPSLSVTPTGRELQVSKEVFVSRGPSSTLVPVSESSRAIQGEPLVVRYTITTDRDLSLLSLIDPRPAGAEHGYDFSGYASSGGVWWYYRRLDQEDRIYIDYLPRGRHVLELRATANVAGGFSYGPAVVESMYAPEFVGNSAGGRLYTDRKRTN